MGKSRGPLSERGVIPPASPGAMMAISIVFPVV